MSNENGATGNEDASQLLVNINGEDVAVDKVRYGDTEIDGKSLSEIQSKASDYTKKTQALADERRSLEERSQTVAELESVRTLAQKNPDAAIEIFEQMIGKREQDVQNKDTKTTSADLNEIDDLRLEIAELRMQNDPSYGTVYGRHSKEILNYAIQRGIPDLQVATTSWMQVNQKMLADEAEAQQKAADAQVEGDKRITTSGGQFTFDSQAVNRDGGFAEQFERFQQSAPKS